MATSESIDTPHGPVTATVDSPSTTTGPPILLAHGAGLGQHHPWMLMMRTRLVVAGHLVMTFDYAYMEAGRKAPDRLPKLLDVHEAVARTLSARVDEILLVGKSMGGRVGSHLVAQGRCSAAGLVYLGYPLVAMGKTEARDTEHLSHIEVPQLFISGTRDRMGPGPAIESVASAVPRGSVEFIQDGDHSLTPLKRSGRTIDDALDRAVASIENWTAREL